MRNIVFYIFIALGLLGCSKDDAPTAPDDLNLIAFGNLSTRARVNGISDVENFGVWATVTSFDELGQINPNQSYKPFMTNEKVYRNPAGSSNWTYDNPKYWINDSYCYFFAAYPYNVGFQELSATQEGLNYTAYSLDVSANGSAVTQDILTAFHCTDTREEGYDTTVPFSFGHLLTKVNFRINQNFDIDPDFNYYVTKVSITGIKGSGTYMMMPYESSYFEYWNMENATPVTLVKEYDTPAPLRDKSLANPKITLSVFGNDGVILIPQEIAANTVEIMVNYLYDTNLNDDDLGVPKSTRAYLPVGQWESGKNIVYTLSISNKSNISFLQPTIEPWGALQTGGTIIIR